jgi:transcriptional antiterminator RfaH
MAADAYHREGIARQTRARDRAHVQPLFVHPLGHGADQLVSYPLNLGLSKLVSFGNRPAVVADELIEALQQLPEQAPQRLIQPGQQVKIVSGPLRGLEGIYQQADGELRAMVLIELLNKQHRIVIDMQDLRPATI